MKGTLHKTDTGWQVSHATYDMMLSCWTAGKFPLHPDDVSLMPFRGQLLDDQHILDGKEVDFEIKYYWDGRMEQPIEVAKLINRSTKILQPIQQDISDEEIEKEASSIHKGRATETNWQYERMGWINGAKWYREQLKKKQ